jgi:hypothetical protein
MRSWPPRRRVEPGTTARPEGQRRSRASRLRCRPGWLVERVILARRWRSTRLAVGLAITQKRKRGCLVARRQFRRLASTRGLASRCVAGRGTIGRLECHRRCSRKRRGTRSCQTPASQRRARGAERLLAIPNALTPAFDEQGRPQPLSPELRVSEAHPARLDGAKELGLLDWSAGETRTCGARYSCGGRAELPLGSKSG